MLAPTVFFTSNILVASFSNLFSLISFPSQLVCPIWFYFSVFSFFPLLLSFFFLPFTPAVLLQYPLVLSSYPAFLFPLQFDPCRFSLLSFFFLPSCCNTPWFLLPPHVIVHLSCSLIQATPIPMGVRDAPIYGLYSNVPQDRVMVFIVIGP